MIDVGRGVVEGFYGPPWSHDARLRMVRAVGELGLDTYAYAPKSDPLHRQRWWEPLPVEELRAFGQLADVAHGYRVRVVYGVAPQRLFGGRRNLRASAQLELDERFDALVRRCASLLSRGVRAFMLLFDDTWLTALPFLSTYEAGRDHARVAALALERLRALDPAVSLCVVPAVYSGRPGELSRGALAYLRGLTSLAPTPIAWTGPKIFSAYVSGAELEAFRAAVGVYPWIWSNAIANDWLPLATGEPLGRTGRQRLCFGPSSNLAPEVYARASGVLLNGAREATTTHAALSALAEQVREPRSFQALAAERRGLERVYGEGADAVARLAALVAGHPLSAPRPALPWQLEAALGSALSGSHEHAARLHAELAALEQLEAELSRSLAGHPGLRELLPTARKLGLASRAIRAAWQREASARGLAREALAIAWDTGLDQVLASIARGRLPAARSD